jgi:hypothetical protein
MECLREVQNKKPGSLGDSNFLARPSTVRWYVPGTGVLWSDAHLCVRTWYCRFEGSYVARSTWYNKDAGTVILTI